MGPSYSNYFYNVKTLYIYIYIYTHTHKVQNQYNLKNVCVYIYIYYYHVRYSCAAERGHIPMTSYLIRMNVRRGH
jgi:hypothetical protein